MTKLTVQPRAVLCLLILLLALGGCDSRSSPTEPGLDVELVAGLYTMTELSFNPRGSLPPVDILAVLDEVPTLNLTPGGQAQIILRDPVTSLITPINGTHRTTARGVRIEFPNASEFRQLLLSPTLSLTLDAEAGTLSFAGTPQGGVSRERLIALVPSLAEEQLLDPTPGVLSLEFTRN